MLRVFNSDKSKDRPPSIAAANMCKTVFVLPPIAISSANAFKIVSLLIISLGFKSFSIRSIITFPASFTRSNLDGSVASIVPLPGRANPSTSIKQFMEFAVNIPEQEPQVGQPFSSKSFNSSSFILPVLYFPTPSKTDTKSILSPFLFTPAFIGPPDTKTVGMLILSAAINIPGTILSQFDIQIKPSNLCDSATVSTLSAISSRLASE